MRVVMLREFGPARNLLAAEAPDPVPGPDELVIDVEFVNITFVETQIRAGRPPHPAMAPALPAILGNGVGGTIAGTGTRVVSSTGGTGGYAERALVRADWPVPVPDGLPLDQATALLADGRTALALIEAAAVSPGETVLVEAAAGGVGSLLIQLARARGAHVIAAAGGPRKTAVTLDLGAGQAVDYTLGNWTDGIQADVVFDGVGGDVARQAAGTLRAGGRICVYGAASGSYGPGHEFPGVKSLYGVPVTAERSRELTAEALAAAAAGRLSPLIGQRFPLARAADAHAAIEARATVGKTLLMT